MKKLIPFLLVAALVLAVHSVYAATATINLSPTSRAVTAGQTFTVAVSVSPSGGSATTVKTKLTFSPAVLEVTGFTFAPNWFPLPPEERTDNIGGSLTRAAGLTNSISTATTFGTVTFRAKTTGAATVTVDGASAVYDSVNNNIFTGGNQTAVTVTGAVSPAPTVSRAPTPRVTATVSRAPTPTPTGTPSLTPVAVISPTASPSTQTATILGFSPRVWAAIAAGLVALLAGWLLTRPPKAV